MTSISRLGRVVVAMRTRQAAATERSTSAAATRAPHTNVAPAADAAAERMRLSVIERLKRLDLDTPQGISQGVRAFLEVVLTQQLGEGLLLSPRFMEIIADVQGVIEDNPSVHGEMKQLLRELKT